MQIVALVVLSFYYFEGSFHFWALFGELVPRPFSTCSSLMSFSPFSRFLSLLSLLVAAFFLLPSLYGVVGLLSLFCGRRFRCCCFWCIFVFVGPSSTQLFPYWFCSHQFAELGSIYCLAFTARACYLAFPCLAILFLAICRAVSWYTCFFFSGWCFEASQAGRSLYWFCWFQLF